MPSGRYNTNSAVLLVNVSATGSGSFADIDGGLYQVHTEGTFAASALTLDGQGPNDTTIAGLTDIAGVAISVTAPTAGKPELRIARGARVRATLTGGAPAGIYARLVKVSD